MNVAINKEAFKNILAQFSGDISFETELLHQLLNQLPEGYVDEIIKEEYFKRLYPKLYFVIQHSVYKADRKCFGRVEEVASYLNSIKVDSKPVTQSVVAYALQKGTTVCGYYIFKEKGKGFSLKGEYLQ